MISYSIVRTAERHFATSHETQIHTNKQQEENSASKSQVAKYFARSEKFSRQKVESSVCVPSSG